MQRDKLMSRPHASRRACARGSTDRAAGSKCKTQRRVFGPFVSYTDVRFQDLQAIVRSLFGSASINDTEQFCGLMGVGLEHAEYTGDEFIPERHFKRSCKAGLKHFMLKVKGLSKADARSFVNEHFVYDIHACDGDDNGDICGVECSVTFTTVNTHNDKPAAFGFTAHLDYFQRQGAYFFDSSSELKVSTFGPTQDACKRDTLIVSNEYEPAAEYNAGMRFDNRLEFVEDCRFSATCLSLAEALRSVCGPRWTIQEAMLLLYTALGFQFKTEVFSFPGVISPVCTSGWLEHKLRKLCKLKSDVEAAKANGSFRGQTFAETVVDDGYESHDPAKELAELIAHRRRQGYIDDDDDDDDDDDCY